LDEDRPDRGDGDQQVDSDHLGAQRAHGLDRHRGAGDNGRGDHQHIAPEQRFQNLRDSERSQNQQPRDDGDGPPPLQEWNLVHDCVLSDLNRWPAATALRVRPQLRGRPNAWAPQCGSAQKAAGRAVYPALATAATRSSTLAMSALWVISMRAEA